MQSTNRGRAVVIFTVALSFPAAFVCAQTKQESLLPPPPADSPSGVNPSFLTNPEAVQVPGANKIDSPSLSLRYKPAEVLPNDDELMKLLKERYNAALSEYAIFTDQIQLTTLPLAQVLERMTELTVLLLESGFEVFQLPADRELLLLRYLEHAAALEKIAIGRSNVGAEDSFESVARARYLHLDAKIRLLKYRRSLAPTKVAPVTTQADCPAVSIAPIETCVELLRR